MTEQELLNGDWIVEPTKPVEHDYVALFPTLNLTEFDLKFIKELKLTPEEVSIIFQIRL